MADNGTRKTIPTPPARNIGINELSPTEWRISDRMIADGYPAALVGFIQRVDDAFEVTDFGRPPGASVLLIL
ncbi:hypothetical protein E3N86_06800 [Cryobacterium sp. Hz7]|uniref:hypothetical protein n=1 Tax=Cryobacterium sp. Hz7 TaxID=1259166 RepID=UPI00106AA416|nr:hypothetical protein [Cryobacterium sp. Hz7]TFB62263.1 hypothetical protein E3N86_06800 [Cryobacterium sp. Hz7]